MIEEEVTKEELKRVVAVEQQGEAVVMDAKMEVVVLVEEKVERVMVEVTVTYADVDALQRLMEDADITVESEKYGAEVRYACGVPVAELDSFRSGVADATRGAGLVREL